MQSINLLSQTFCKYSKFSLPSPRNPRAVALTTMHIILDNGHGLNTPGKRSPDGTLIEAIYTRQLVKDLALELEKHGHTVHILVPEQEDIPLNVRVKRINAICRAKGIENTILISIHLNDRRNAHPGLPRRRRSSRGRVILSSMNFIDEARSGKFSAAGF